MVAMNPQTWNADIKEIEPGGYLFYDNSKHLPQSRFRDDIHVIGMPLTEMCNSTYTDARERQLFKNIIYVGALSSLLDMDPDAITELIGEQYKGKEKLLKPNVNAFQMGRDDRLACAARHKREERAHGERAALAHSIEQWLYACGQGRNIGIGAAAACISALAMQKVILQINQKQGSLFRRELRAHRSPLS